MPDKGSVRVFGPCQAPLQTTSYKSDSIFGPLESFKRAHSAYTNAGFGHTMICAELFQNVSSVMNDSNLTPHKQQSKKKLKGRHTDMKVQSGLLEPIDEEDMYAEDAKRNRDASRRLSLSHDVDASNSMEAIKRESLRVRRSRLEEDILRLDKRLQSEIDLREAFECALSDACDAIPAHLPLEVQELLGDIAMLEVTVLSLEEELMACQWRLCQERKGRIMMQNYGGVSTSSQETPTSDRKVLQSLQKPQLQEDYLIQGAASDLSPATPEVQRRTTGRYSDAESLDYRDNYEEDLCTSNQPSEDSALAVLCEPESLRRSSFRSNCSDEDFARFCNVPHHDRSESLPSISVSEEGDRLKYKKHQRKKSRQKHLDLATGSNSFAMLPTTPPQDIDDSCNSSFRRRNSLVLRGLSLHPNKLSEKMLRCMMDIYCHLSDSAPVTTTSSPTSPFTPAVTTSSVSSLSDSSFLSFGRSPLVDLPNKEEVVGSESLFDPYRSKEKLSWVDIGIYSSAREIRWISVGKEQLGYAARALREYKFLVEQLAKVDILSMAHEEKLAFWINIYNALLMHGYLAYGIPKSELKSFFLMQKASYVIGGHAFTALAIEYHLLKHKAPAHRPQIALLLALHKVKLTLEQSKLAIDYPEPLTAFALSCGARSSPLVKVYTADNVVQQLKSSLHDYIRASVGLGVRGKLLIPKLLYVYAHETMDDSSLLGWIFLHLPSSQVGIIQDCLHQRKHRFLSSRNFAILPFDFRFQYLFFNC